VYIINGVEYHIHILFALHPSVSLSSLVKVIKLASFQLIKEPNLFPFTSWQKGYAAFTYSLEAKDNLIEYFKKQEEDHKEFNFKEELITLLEENRVEYDLQYLE
jgi:putative transposase